MLNESNLLSVLSIIAEAGLSANATWLTGGSAGLLLRGIKLDNSPRDLDIYADESDALRLHEMLQSYATDQQQVSVSGIYRSVLSHYLIEGVPVELVGGFVITSREDRYAVQVTQVLAPRQLSLSVKGTAIGIVPLAHEMWFNLLRERLDRVALIAGAVRTEPAVHLEAFEAIEAANQLSGSSIGAIHDLIGISRNEGPL
ncbi:hypothetical protein ACFOLF_05375 [Paenibacillus sepulcri]|uniref:Nucleotidyl transferase AbiEii/AbiGii toxin family protein n=1 Tax=Paenibacillus sepulcri TaxID=359917 RepID=A0ABS7C4V2_9BACL|nr:hypothetical protein [Paenibacillus sepulcri]